MEDVRDEVGNLNSEVAGSEVESERVGSILTESVGVEQPIIVGVQLSAAGLETFRRNGWGVVELDATYDADDQIEPVFEELRADESRVGLDVRTFRDAHGNTHVMAQRERPVLDDVLADLGWGQWRRTLDGASLSGRSQLWESLRGDCCGVEARL
jgi:hypothetical protein